MRNLEEKTLKTEKIFSGRVISIQVDEVELPNGNTSTRELVKHPGAVAIIAITSEGKLVVVEQFRKALEKTIIEIPAGKLEANEDPKLCAERELEEETGYGCKQIKWISSFYTSPGFADEIVHLYLAENLYKIENAAGLDEDEFVNLLEIDLHEAKSFIKEQRIFDAKTFLAVQYIELMKLMEK